MILKDLKDAQNSILENIIAMSETEIVGLADSHGRVVAGDACPNFNIPPFDTSAMDGFAVVSADFSKGVEGLVLKVVDEVAAGAVSAVTLESGQAIKIMTGAPLPAGADAILIKENAVETKEAAKWEVAPLVPVKSGLHVRRTGADLKTGEPALKKGALVTPPALGILASIAMSEVSVYKRPRVAILSTGDELIDPLDDIARGANFTPGPGKIMNSNLYMLGALVKECGAEPVLLGIAKDTPDEIAAKINEGADVADIIITTGGASVGSYDFIPDALKLCGFDVEIWKMNMKPGRPFIYGLKKSGSTRKSVFGLPGNPASSFVSFIQLIRPAVLKLCGRADVLECLYVNGRLDGDIKMDPERVTYTRSRIFYDETAGEAVISVPSKQDSNILSTALSANCLAEVKPGAGVLKKGAAVRARII